MSDLPALKFTYCANMMHVYDPLYQQVRPDKQDGYVPNLTWRAFVDHGHLENIQRYVGQLSSRENPSHVRPMDPPYSEQEWTSILQENTGFVFGDTLTSYLTQFSRCLCDDAFTPLLSSKMQGPQIHSIPGNLIVEVDEDGLVHMTAKDDEDKEALDSFMLPLPVLEEVDSDCFHQTHEQLCIYLGEYLDLPVDGSRFALANGSVWERKKDGSYMLCYSSILDVAILIYFYNYHRICRWDG